MKLTKKQTALQDQSLERQKYEKIHHLADRNHSIGLDDGVKHNYALFADVLAKLSNGGKVVELIEEIQNLIALKTEGDYWDFKEMWYNNKASLLHDIICMANNQVGRDAYIIIGVSDSKSPDGVKVKGVSETNNRKDQNQLIGFLRDKKFAGGLRPSVYLETIELPDDDNINKKVDVIIVKDSEKTPFFLLKDFEDDKNKGKKIRAGYIYTRIGDTNTAIDSMADMDKIEYLWRKRFGIDLSAVEKLLRFLEFPDDWVGDLNWGNFKYYKYFPEFQIHIEDIEDQSQFSNNSIMRNIADRQADKNYHVSNLIIQYHSTILYKEYVIYFDKYRHLIPFPNTYTVYVDTLIGREPSLTYLYLNMDSISGKLYRCFACTEHNWYNEKWDLRPGVGFLVFEDEAEQKQFDIFAREQLYTIEDEYTKALKSKNYVHNPSTEEYFIGGWSKANEIKSWHLYEQFKDIGGSSLPDKLPEMPVDNF